MNYYKLYHNLVSFRLKYPASGYTERHHIIPRSMGGVDDDTNIVTLTGREHWIAHLFLYKIYKNSQMAHACHMMAMRCEERGVPQVRNSRMYEQIRKICAKATSKRMKLAQKGERNSQYGTRYICNVVLKENRKIRREDEVPEGWILGRNRWKEIDKRAERSKREKLQKYIKITNGKTNKYLKYKDQLPVPEGWVVGVTMTDEHRLKNSIRMTGRNKLLKGGPGQGGWRKRKEDNSNL